jgi:hypothetical protein
MTGQPPRHLLIRLTGACTTATGTLGAIGVIVASTLIGSAPTAIDLAWIALMITYAALGVGVVRRSLRAARGAGVISIVLALVALTPTIALGPRPAYLLLLAVSIAAGLLFMALLATANTLAAEQNASHGGRYARTARPQHVQNPQPPPAQWFDPLDDVVLDAATRRVPYPYPHPLPEPVKQAHIAVIRRCLVRELWLFGLVFMPGAALLMVMTASAAPGASTWAMSPTLIGAAAVITSSALGKRAWFRRRRHRTLLVEYGVLLDTFGREIPVR